MAYGAVRIASVSGNWSNPVTWGGAAAPTSADDITINAGIVVVMDVNGTCGVITDMPGGSISGPGTLRIMGISGNAISDISGTAFISCPLIIPDDAAITVSGSLSITGVISGAAINLIKNGGGKLILAGANQYDGITTVNAGILNLRDQQGAGTAANGIVVNDSGQLELESPIMMFINESLSLSGSGVSGGALFNVTGTNVWFGPIIIDGVDTRINIAAGDLLIFNSIDLKNNLLTFQGASNTFIAGSVTNSGTGSIIKAGTGELSFGTQVVTVHTLTLNDGKLISTTGNLNLTGDFSNNSGIFDPNGGTIEMNGSANQFIGGAQQTTFNNLIINNPSGVTLGNSESVDGVLTLTNGRLTLDTNNLILGLAPVAGTPSVSNMIVTNNTGECRRVFTTNDSYVFPVGDVDGSPDYSPVTLSFTSGTYAPGAYAGVRVIDGVHPDNASATDYLTRYWTVTQSGITVLTYDVTGTFINSTDDITGNIANIITGMWDGLIWQNYNPVTAPAISATGVTDSGDFTGISLITSTLPTITLGADPILCSGYLSAFLPYTSTTESPDLYAINWNLAALTTGFSDVPLTSLPSSPIGIVVPAGASANTYTGSITVYNSITGESSTGTTFAVTINPEPGITIANQTNVNCFGNSTGSIDISVAGGTPVYIYSWTKNGSAFTTSTEDLTGLQAGEYSVTVFDAKGCSATQTATITQPDELSLLLTPTNATCFGENKSISAAISGSPFSDLEINIDGSAFAPVASSPVVFNSLIAGSHTITIRRTSDNSCTVSKIVSVNEPTVLTAGSIGAEQTICYNTVPAGLTELTQATGGVGPYIYQWQSSPNGAAPWTDIPGANAFAYSPGQLTTTTWFRRAVSYGSCGPAYSNSIKITVYDLLNGGSIGSDQSICYNSIPNTFTNDINPTGGTSLTYQWQQKVGAGLWTNISGATGLQYSVTSSLTQTTKYRRITSAASGCGPAYSNEITISVYSNITGGSIGITQTICYNTIPAGLTELTSPTGGTGNYTYQWQHSANNLTWTNISGSTSASFSPGALLVNSYYRRVVSSGSCGTAFTFSVLISVRPELTVPVASGDRTICYNTLPTALSASAASGGSGIFTYQWQSSNDTIVWADISGATNYSAYSPPALTSTTYYRIVATSTGIPACGTLISNIVTIKVLPELISPVVTAGQSICYNTVPLQLTTTSASGGNDTFIYQWFSSLNNLSWSYLSGATGLTFQPSSLTASTYYHVIATATGTPYCGSITSNPVLINVNPNLTSGTIGTAQAICYNTIPASLTELTPSAGGTGSYTYQWQSSPNNLTWTNILGSTSSSYSPGALISSTYYRRVVSSGSCGTAYSSGVLISVRPNLAAPVVSVDRTICYNTVPAALSATPASGGSGIFTYQWQSSPDNSTWTNISGATNYSTYSPPALISTCYYRLVALSVGLPACGTVTSNVVTISVLPELISPIVSADQTICYNTDPLQLTSTTASGGNDTFIYQWFSSLNNTSWSYISGATGLTYQPSALAASTYYHIIATATGTPACGGQTSNSVLITVNPNIAAGTIGTTQTICYNTSPARLTELTSATGGTGSYTYQWQSSPNNFTWTNILDSTLATYSPGPLLSSTYFRRVISSGSCGTASSFGILITVRPNITAPVVLGNQTICYNTSPGSLTATAASGGSGSFAYQWQSSPDNSVWANIIGATNYSSYSPPTLTSISYYRLVATSLGTPSCELVTSNVAKITVLPVLNSPVASADQTICYNTVPLQLTSIPARGGNETFTYQWFSSSNNITWSFISGATALTYQPSSLNASTYYHVVATATGTPACGNQTSNPVLIRVNSNLTSGTIGTAQTICYNATPARLTELTPATGGIGSYTYQWQSSPNNFTWTNILDSTLSTYSPGVLLASTYYRRVVSSGSCGTAYSFGILISVRPDLTGPVVSGNRSVCYNTVPAALSASAAVGGSGTFTYQWQSSLDNSVWTNIAGATNYISYSPPALTATTYYRLVATATGTPSCGTVTSNVVTITVLPDLISPVVSADQTICYNTAPLQLTSTIALGGNGSFSYQWYSSLNNISWSMISGETTLTYQPAILTATTYYHVIATATGTPACGSKISNPALITVRPNPVVTATPAAQTICSGNATSIALSSIVSGTTFDWTVVESGVSGASAGSGVNISQLMTVTGTTTGTATYIITPKVNGCTGTSKIVVITVNPIPQITATPALQTICSPTAPSIALTSNLPLTTYTWTVAQSGVSGAYAGSGTIIAQTLSAIGTSAGTASYTITPALNGCAGVPLAVIITVNPTPVATATPTAQTICSGTAPSILLTSNISGTSFNWSVFESGVSGASSGSGTVIDQTLTATGGTAGIVIYTITPTANSCNGAVKTVVITVRPKPVATATPASQTICSGTTTSIAFTSNISGTTYSWTTALVPPGSISGATAGSGNSIAQTLSNSTLSQAEVNYTVTPASGSCAGDPLAVAVTVNPVSVLSSSFVATVCSNTIFNYIPTSTTPATTFSWTRGVVLGIQNSASSGTGDVNETLVNTTGISKTVTYVYALTSFGCTTFQNVLVTVYPSPILLSSLSPPAICSNTPFDYTAISSIAGTTITWTRAVVAGISNPTATGSGNISETLINTTASDQVVSYVYALTLSGCSSTFTVNVTVKPTPTVNLPADMEFCNGSNVPAILFTGPVTGTTYTWGNNNTAIGLAASGVGNISSFSAINNTSTQLNAIISVRPAANSCNGTNSTFTISVHPSSNGGVVNSDASVCSGANSGTLTLSGHTGNVVKWQSSTDAGVTWIDINNITSTLSYTNLILTTEFRTVVQSSVCTPAYSSIATITVNEASFGGTVTADAIVCYGTNNGTLTLSGQAGTVTKWQSSINGGTSWVDIINTSAIQAYTNLTTTTQYRSVVQSGVCASAISSIVTIDVNPASVGGTLTGGTTVCSGVNNTLLTLTGFTGSIIKWQSSAVADFSSGVTDISNTTASLTAINLVSTTYYRAVVTSGVCSTVYSTPVLITVNPLPVANAGGSQTICSNGTATVIAAVAASGTIVWTENGAGSIVSGVTTLAPVYAATVGDAGNSVVLTMTVTSNNVCAPQTATAIYTVIVDPLPVAIAGGSQTICSNGSATISGASATNGTILWTENGAGSITSGSNTLTPVYTAAVADAGTIVTLTMTVTSNNSCAAQTATATYTIGVNPLPTVDAGGSQTICSSETATVSGASASNGTILWTEDGAGSITAGSTTLTPTYTSVAADAGNTVTLTMTLTSTNACAPQTASATYSVLVNQASIGGSVSGDATVCSGTNSTILILNGYTGSITKWQSSPLADFSSGVIDIANTTNSLTATNLGTTTFYRAVVQNGTCPVSNSSIATITVNPTPVLSSTLTPSGICSNEAFSYLPTSITAGTTFNWTRAFITGISNPSNSGTDNPDEFLQNTTSSPISVTYVYSLSSNSCSNTQNVVLFVTPTPHLTSTTTPPPICGGTIFSYIPTSDVTGTTFPWTRAATLGNPAASGIGNPNEILINNTTSTGSVTYLYTLSSNDCVNPVIYPVTLTVVPAPVVMVSASSAAICPGGDINLFSSSNITTNLPTLLSENFNTAATGATTGPNGWTATNASVGGTTANARWTVRADGYTYGGNVYHSNDNSKFYFSNSDAQNGSSTLTTLISPKISTNNYTSLSLDFYDYYNDKGATSGDFAYIDVTTNDGASWITLSTPDYFENTDHGGRTSFAHQIINLGAYIGYSDFRFRFRYVATDDRYWAIDNVTLSGTPTVTATIAWTSNTSSWSSSIANPVAVIPPSTTTYTATYTDPTSLCSGSNSVTVTVNPTPTPVITADYCAYRPKVFLSTTQPYASYLWSTGATTQSIQVDIAGNYTVNVTDTSGCTGSATILVAEEKVVDGSFTNFNAVSPSFTTEYTQQQSYYTGVATSGLWPEEYYAVNTSAWSNYPSTPQGYHTAFHGQDHTNNYSGARNFLMVNGSTSLIGTPARQRIIWQQTVTVDPNTDYYFSAWAMNLNPTSPAQLQFEVNGVLVGTVADLNLAEKPTTESAVGLSNWMRFYSNPMWNSGSATTAVIRIRNLNTTAGGNDFGIDDISFGTLASIPFSFTASNNSPICSRNSLQLSSTILGGKMPITYSWTGPNGYTSTDANPIINNIAPSAGGTYSLSVIDSYNCPVTPVTTIVTLNPTPEIPNQTALICSGNTFNATPINGVPDGNTFVPVGTTYSWSAPSIIPAGSITGASAQTAQAGISQTLTNTTNSPASVTYIVTPVNGTCTENTFTVTVTVNPVVTANAGANQQICTGNTVQLNGSVGGAATTGVWTGGTGSFNPNRNTLNAVYTPSAAERTAGTVTLTLTSNDADGAGPCSAAVSTVIITINALPVLSTSVVNVSCHGTSTGSVDLTVSGGTPGYTYLWTSSNGGIVPSGQENIQDLSALEAGTYSVAVNDTKSCGASLSVTLTEPTLLIAHESHTTLPCVIGATTVTITATGGTAPYTGTGSFAQFAGTTVYTVTDATGCTATVPATVIADPNSAPVITTCPVMRSFNGCSTAAISGPVFSAIITNSTYAEYSNTNNKGVATDNCAVTSVSYQDVAASGCPIVVTRTWTLGDASGLTTTCQQILNVNDVVAPTWINSVGALNRLVECSDASGLSAALALFPTASDACDPDVSNIVKTSGSFVASAGCSHEGTYTNTWRVTDECGNTSAEYAQIITVTDNTAPTWVTAIGALDQITECSNVAAIHAAQALRPVASDLCDANVTNVVKVSGIFIAGGLCSNAGTYTNTFTVTDDCGNVSSVYTQVITIVDNTAPVWVSAPGEINYTVACNDVIGLSGAQALFPLAWDNCAADVSNISKTAGLFVPSAGCPQEGTYTNTWIVTDGCGNISDVYTQQITLVDNAGPMILCPISSALSCDSPSFDPFVTGTAAVIDNCDANPSLTWSDVIIPGGCAGNYQIVRTWTATDACGKSNTCSQSVFIQDVTPPVISSSVSGNLDVNPSPSISYIAPDNTLDATATDNCSGVILSAELTGVTTSGPYSSLMGVTFNEGVTTVTWTATDGCGISSSSQYTVTVTLAPQISCPADINRNNDLDLCDATLNPGFLSLVIGTTPIAYTWTMTGATFGAGTGPIGYYTFNKGVTTITWTATNAAGGDVCTQTISVIDNQPPLFNILTDLMYCVEEITTAEYYDPTMDITPGRPDYYIFKAGNPDLDLDPSTFSDNCPISCLFEIRWRIDFEDGTFLPALPDTYITGQPSAYGLDIQFPGDAILNVFHNITYQIVDCNGNVSAPHQRKITIDPRPDITKVTPP